MTLRNRWPGTVDTVTLDSHCQPILEVPAKPNVLLASFFDKCGLFEGWYIFVLWMNCILDNIQYSKIHCFAL